jgi:hypothetical protein
MPTITLQSAPHLCHAPGIVRWAQAGYAFGDRRDAQRMVAIISEGWGLDRRIALALISCHIETSVNHETGTVALHIPEGQPVGEADCWRWFATEPAAGAPFEVNPCGDYPMVSPKDGDPLDQWERDLADGIAEAIADDAQIMAAVQAAADAHATQR